MEDKKPKNSSEDSQKKNAEPEKKNEESSFWGKLGNFVKESIDCCLE